MQKMLSVDNYLRVRGSKINGLTFADDEALVAENTEEIIKLAEVFIGEARKVGLQVIEYTTKSMK